MGNHVRIFKFGSRNIERQITKTLHFIENVLRFPFPSPGKFFIRTLLNTSQLANEGHSLNPRMKIDTSSPTMDQDETIFDKSQFIVTTKFQLSHHPVSLEILLHYSVITRILLKLLQ